MSQANRWMAVLGLVALSACGAEEAKKEEPKAKEPAAPKAEWKAPTPVQEPISGGPFPALLLGQAQFYKPEGKIVPGPALLTIWRKTDSGWTSSRLEDPDSNVFHKAIEYQGGILTIGAEKALLKKWTFKDGAWQQETLWAPAPWGGKFNRIRDLEIGDVDGDGTEDLVMATHDAGVIAVGRWKDGKLDVVELDKAADTFVHEIEIGDVDGDGKNEFFATPSGRNQSSGESQPGQVVMYKYDGTTFVRTVVEDFTGSHAKEVLTVDLDGKGVSTLFSVVEAETKLEGGVAKVVHPVEIRKYTWDKKAKTFSSEVVGTIEDKQTRFLVPADFDGDGAIELVAAAMKSGIWVLERGEDGKWTNTNIERSSSGFEHTAYAADIDGNKIPELYVAADDQRELRAYQYNPTSKLYEKTVIGPIADGVITWNMKVGNF